jgi:hypothetical protein
MRRLRSERGATLLIIIGITATLAISAAALVPLLGNVQANTQQTRSGTKSFNVAEGALNVAMQKLKTAWPVDAASGAAWTSADYQAFRDEYSTSEYPNPATGSFVTVSIFDDADSNGDGAITPADVNYDRSGLDGTASNPVPDNEVYIRVTAHVGTGTATIQGLAVRTMWSPAFPRGVAVYSGGAITSNSQGGGTMPKVTVEVPPPTEDQTATAYASTGYSPPAIMDSGSIDVKTGADVPALSDIISASLLADLKNTAIQGHRYFSGATAATDAENSPKSEMGGPGLQGLTYIEPAAGTSGVITLPANTEQTPACLVVMGGNDWNFNNAGSGDTYGFYYTQGNFDFSRGNYSIHGMIVCAGDVGFKGTPQLLYNDNVIVNLMSEWTLNVKLAPNSWRELSPGAEN